MSAPGSVVSGEPPAVDDEIRAEAAAWYVRLNSGEASDAERTRWQAWLGASPLHRQVWNTIEAIGDELRSLPPGVALPALQRKRGAARGRWSKVIATIAGIAAIAWGALQYQALPVPIDLATALGEQRTYPLEDGTRLTLNSASSASVLYSDEERRVELHTGELFVETAPDPGPRHRPFRVLSIDGQLTALGTRFGVRRDAAATMVAVVDGRVEIQPRAGGTARILAAGQSARFHANGIEGTAPLTPDMVSWTSGRLVVEDLPLATVVAELARYWSGTISYSPSIAALRVSGTFPLDDPERAISILGSTMPLRIDRSSTGEIRLLPH